MLSTALSGDRGAAANLTQNTITNQLNQDKLKLDRDYKAGLIDNKTAIAENNRIKAQLADERRKTAELNRIEKDRLTAEYRDNTNRIAKQRADTADLRAKIAQQVADKPGSKTKTEKTISTTLRSKLFDITHKYSTTAKKFIGPKDGGDINILDIEALDKTAREFGHNIGYIKLPEMITKYGDDLDDKKARILPFPYAEGDTPNEEVFKKILINDYGYSEAEAERHIAIWTDSMKGK